MTSSLRDEAEAFLLEYGMLWNPPPSMAEVNALGEKVSKYYRPGATFFTNGTISSFKTQEQSAQLIASELVKTINNGIGAHLILQKHRVEIYSTTSALCYLTFTFRTPKDSRYKGQEWTFENVYGYRAASGGVAAGWEWVLRDNEVNEMLRATGASF